MGTMTTYRVLAPPSPRERARRAGILALIGALHVVAILWLASQSSRIDPHQESGINLINIAAPPGGTNERAPPNPSESMTEKIPSVVIAQSPLPSIPAAAAFATPTASSGGDVSAGGCALAQAVGNAIRTDSAAVAELEALPPQARTQADAVMLWDGRWQGSEAVSANVTASVLRQVIEQAVRDAEAECREAPVNGPQFIALPGPSRTTMIVIGSGQWHWVDLIRTDILSEDK